MFIVLTVFLTKQNAVSLTRKSAVSANTCLNSTNSGILSTNIKQYVQA